MRIKNYQNLTQNELNNKFIEACGNGNLEVVQYLLTAPELKKLIKVNSNDSYGFGMACRFGHLNVVKYLLTSPELGKHANVHASKDYGFRMACLNGYLEIVKFLIFNINIKNTKNIKSFLNSYNFQEIENLFKVRDLNKKLESELGFSCNEKRNKV